MSDGYTPRIQGAYLTPTVAAEQVSGGFGSATIMGVEGLFCLLTTQRHLAVSREPSPGLCRLRSALQQGQKGHKWLSACHHQVGTDGAEHPPSDGTEMRQISAANVDPVVQTQISWTLCMLLVALTLSDVWM